MNKKRRVVCKTPHPSWEAAAPGDGCPGRFSMKSHDEQDGAPASSAASLGDRAGPLRGLHGVLGTLTPHVTHPQSQTPGAQDRDGLCCHSCPLGQSDRAGRHLLPASVLLYVRVLHMRPWLYPLHSLRLSLGSEHTSVFQKN